MKNSFDICPPFVNWSNRKKANNCITIIENSFLTNLVNEYSKLEYAVPMADTPLADIFELIKPTAEAYGIALKSSQDATAAIKTAASATSMRDPLTDSYNKCYYHIQANAHVSTDAAWSRLLASIALLHVKELTKMRTKKTLADNVAEQNKVRPIVTPAASGSTTDTQAV